jgi:malate/lactate dehydrogenase
MEQVVEIELTPEELAALNRSAEAVRELLNVMKQG